MLCLAAQLTTRTTPCKLAAAREPKQPDFHSPIVTSKKSTAVEVAIPVPDFEASLAELEAIVDKLEQGDLSLDDSLKQFERGVQLTRVCQTALRQAEQKVEILLRKTGQGQNADQPVDPSAEFAPAPFESDEDDDR